MTVVKSKLPFCSVCRRNVPQIIEENELSILYYCEGCGNFLLKWKVNMFDRQKREERPA
jgi:hypothetical protein